MVVATARGFPRSEFEARTTRAQAAMVRDSFDAVVVTTPANVRYFSGFATEFWESPTRPWFIVVPREGRPIAVIPEIGAPAMQTTWVEDIRTWPAPQPEDDGISLLAGTLSGLTRITGRIGWEMGREMALRMPVSDFLTLRDRVHGLEFADASPLIWSLRMIKSDQEIARVRTICGLASEAFAAMPSALRMGDTERQAASRLRLELAQRQVDSVPFVAASVGEAGYDQIIVGSRERRCEEGAILFMDLGATWDGYFCDFDRNFGFGKVADAALRAHETVWQATEAGIAAVRPGATTSQLWSAMSRVLENGGARELNVGRLGHGLGMQLTEPPSNTPVDETPLVPGMIMTIEPGMEYAAGKMIVHEENVLVTEDGCELLTRRAPQELPIIEG